MKISSTSISLAVGVIVATPLCYWILDECIGSAIMSLIVIASIIKDNVMSRGE